MKARTHALVWSRAGHRCEYCRLQQEDEPFYRLHVEHIVAKQHGGTDDPDNLALACHHDNEHKGPNLSGIDPQTGKVVRLFHPRRQRPHSSLRGNGAGHRDDRTGSPPPRQARERAVCRRLQFGAAPRPPRQANAPQGCKACPRWRTECRSTTRPARRSPADPRRRNGGRSSSRVVALPFLPPHTSARGFPASSRIAPPAAAARPGMRLQFAALGPVVGFFVVADVAQ